MKRMIITSLALTCLLALAYNSHAAFWAWSSASALSIYQNGNCNWVPLCADDNTPERHWLANFYNSTLTCDTTKRPRYSGSDIPTGNWYTAGDTDQQYQLTKGWLDNWPTPGCISVLPCTSCSQTTYSCTLSNFTAYCFIN